MSTAQVPPARGAGGAARLRRAAPPLLLCALGALAYAGALGGAFQFDDLHAVVENPWIRSFRFAGRWLVDPGAFSVLPQNQDFRPLVLLAHAVSWALGGGPSPVAFHLVNLAVHLACGVLVFRIARELLGRGEGEAGAAGVPWAALLAGAVFLVHPLQSETVDYVSCRSESLAALGLLAGFHAHLRGRPGRALAWMALGLSAKAVAIVLPALCWLEEVVLRRQPPLPRGRRALRYAGYAAVALAYLAVRQLVVSALSVESRATTPRLAYLLTQARAFWHYLGLFLLPVGQSADADFPLTLRAADPAFLRAAAALAALALGAFGLRRRAALPVFGLAWFAVVLSPTSTIFPLAEAVNEHRPYAAVAGLCFGLAWAARWAARGPLAGWRPGTRAACAAALLAALAAATWQRNRVWRDELTLWSDVVAGAPGNGRAHLNLGLALAARGRVEEALAEYAACRRAWPAWAYCPLDEAVLRGALGQRREALALLDRAERLDPRLFWIPYHRGALLRQTDPRAALGDLERAVALSPGFPAAHRELAAAAAAVGDAPRARAEVERALGLDPRDGEAWALRGYLEQVTGDRRAARADALAAVALAPRLVQPRVNLGWLAEEEGDLAGAHGWYASAAALTPGDRDVLQRLARVRQGLAEGTPAQAARDPGAGAP